MGWGFNIPFTNTYIGEEGITERSFQGGGGLNTQNSDGTLTAQRDNLTRLREQAQEMASRYRAALPQYQQGLIGIAQQTNRQQLANKIQAQNEDLNRRGLISGGIAQGKAAKASAESQAQLAQQESDIAKSVADQAQQFDDSVANLGVNLANVEAGQQDEYFRNALQNMQTRTQAYGQAGNALGTIVGSYLANRSK